MNKSFTYHVHEKMDFKLFEHMEFSKPILGCNCLKNGQKTKHLP